MNQPFLPYSRQSIDDDDVAAVSAALRSDFLTTGPHVEEFEAAITAATGAGHAVVVTSGTAALHLAVQAAGCKEGDIWIVPAVSFVATANAVRYCGGEVVFADVDPDTGLMRPADLEAALERAGPAAKGILPVHLTGQVESPETIAGIAARHGLAVIEDAAHSLGGRYGTFRVGECAHSSMSCLSLHPVKMVTMGEGGVVTTNDPALAARLRRLRTHGIERDPQHFRDRALAFADGQVNPWYYEQHELGFNYRATDLQCALGTSQLRKMDRFVAERARLRALYPAALPNSVSLVPERGHQKPGWHLAVALIDFEKIGIDRGKVMHTLRDRGIGTQVHYIPIPFQPYYAERYGPVVLPGATEYYKRCLSLPLFVGMTERDIEWVGAALGEIIT
jgi:UDP-4-amino-4,6-dideoxy-N-acetyl-beta-L-altrosamine transaminase